ncbi:MAG: hypothetical protein H7Y11_10405, partial [Armatimonadetes bacterium]|nr:hypothetical protein [Anaerolineae bacterium]
GVAVGLQPRFGLSSLMLADSAKHLLHALLAALLLRRRLGGFGQQRLLLTFAKTGVAALAMGITAHLLIPALVAAVGLDTLTHEIIVVGVSGAVCTAVFIGLAALLKIDEFYWLAALIRQRVPRLNRR